MATAEEDSSPDSILQRYFPNEKAQLDTLFSNLERVRGEIRDALEQTNQLDPTSIPHSMLSESDDDDDTLTIDPPISTNRKASSNASTDHQDQDDEDSFAMNTQELSNANLLKKTGRKRYNVRLVQETKTLGSAVMVRSSSSFVKFLRRKAKKLEVPFKKYIHEDTQAKVIYTTVLSI